MFSFLVYQNLLIVEGVADSLPLELVYQLDQKTCARTN